MTTLKEKFEGKGLNLALCLAVAWIVVAAIFELLSGKPSLEGQACGPSHHWKYMQTNVTLPDLSCEPDR